MAVRVRSFAKINLGLCIGPARQDGFHELRTVYQTIALHDLLSIEVKRGSGIEIRCSNPAVPCDTTNTCYRMVDKALAVLKITARVAILIEKNLPVQGGLGGASGNAVAALIALERALAKKLPASERLRIAAEVGSDVPLFLIGGMVLGVGRGEEVYPLPEVPSVTCVVALPDISVSTPQAFRDWDRAVALRANGPPRAAVPTRAEVKPKLTGAGASDRITEFSRAVSAWLAVPQKKPGEIASGVSAARGGRAGNPLLDLVRTGIENDFEQVVFSKYPELREVKAVLAGSGAIYASLSGSGSAVYGLFAARQKAERAVARLKERQVRAVVTTTSARTQYWAKMPG
jgi:4-diphosphocytidyl-2-C-methyl-D-erythritol kinase